MDKFVDFTIKIKKLCDIDLTCYKERQMKRRINALMKRNGLIDYDDYFKLILRNEKKLHEFLDYITINVSEFFRNPAQWDILEKKVIPKLLETNDKIKIWSSACASGEEPYSLAILAHEMGIKDMVTILASDVDLNAIDKAKQGIYHVKSFANIKLPLINKYFIKTDHNDRYIIRDTIKEAVEFKKINLLDDTFPKLNNLILCRNVMIYFTEEAKIKLYKKFNSVLVDEGIFFVGNTEQIIMPQNYGFVSIKNFFYKKLKN